MDNIAIFKTRLRRLGIEVEFFSNYPWIYLEKVNGIRVNERYHANHGFTAFWYTKDGPEISDIGEVFKVIRKTLLSKDFT